MSKESDRLREDAHEIYLLAFTGYRSPRSDEYKAGVRAGIFFQMCGDGLNCPHTEGTAASDAWYAGLEEGRRRGAAEMQKRKPDEPETGVNHMGGLASFSKKKTT